MQFKIQKSKKLQSLKIKKKKDEIQRAKDTLGRTQTLGLYLQLVLEKLSV